MLKAAKHYCFAAYFCADISRVGGELGIRTLGTLRTQHFECCTFDLSDNSPYMLTRFCEINANIRLY